MESYSDLISNRLCIDASMLMGKGVGVSASQKHTPESAQTHNRQRPRNMAHVRSKTHAHGSLASPHDSGINGFNGFPSHPSPQKMRNNNNSVAECDRFAVHRSMNSGTVRQNNRQNYTILENGYVDKVIRSPVKTQPPSSAELSYNRRNHVGRGHTVANGHTVQNGLSSAALDYRRSVSNPVQSPTIGSGSLFESELKSMSCDFLSAHLCGVIMSQAEDAMLASNTQTPQKMTPSNATNGNSTPKRSMRPRLLKRSKHIPISKSTDALDRISSAGLTGPDRCSDSSVENTDDYGFLPKYNNFVSAPVAMSKAAKSPVPSQKNLTRRWRKFRTSSPSKTDDCLWTPCDEERCCWRSVRGQRVYLTPTCLLQLTEAERITLRKLSLAKLQDLDLGCSINLPKDGSHKRSKRSAFLLKRRSNGAGIWDQLKERRQGQSYVFGIPIAKCVANDSDLRRQCRTIPTYRGVDASPAPGGAAGGGTPVHTRKSSCSSAGAISSDSISETEAVVSSPHHHSSSHHHHHHHHSSGSDLLDALSLSSSAQLELNEHNHQSNRASLKPHTLQVPYVVRTCCKHIETHGLHTKGIFRIGSSKKRTKQLREEFDSGGDVYLSDEYSAHDVAALLKEYLRELPDPLLTRDLYAAFVATRQVSDPSVRISALRHLISLLPAPNRDTLWALLKFLHNVHKHSSDSIDSKTGEEIPGNKMDIHNLATLFGPNILHKAKGGEYEVETAERADERREVIAVVEELLVNQRDLFTLSADSYDELLRTLQKTNPDGVDLLMRRRLTLISEYHQAEAASSSGFYDDDSSSAVCSSLSSEVESSSPPSHDRFASGGVSSPRQDRRGVMSPQSPSSPRSPTARNIMIPKLQVQSRSPAKLSSAGILATPRLLRSKRLQRSKTLEPQASGLLSIPSASRHTRGSTSESLSSASSYYPSSRSTSHSPTSPEGSSGGGAGVGGGAHWSSDSSSHPSPERGHTPEVGTSSTHRPLGIDPQRARVQMSRRHSEDRTSSLPQWQSERWKHWESLAKQHSDENKEQETLV